ncbi:D-isomer specific 2-hydroxyacid dehydrogenase [Lasiosphaeria miniovina]|uniref:D-isomer specific 2-hydroxyacid dehydrogenase n=1 Tax=Lasiosphaeria miniovina TaxID=1954250 RepID=A0AA40E061_9PEZI|nr:D-isomer specific 2-hydroxyacid dehydrogenase [Lasiosphaeria miniovina]KAK0717858.1 D-isomer specific 2-hydroxyacid dehydrogenase [Lasiosphaeria miniovina]
MGANKTLKGHKLLIATPWEVVPGFLDTLKAEFPDLEVVFHKIAWALEPAVLGDDVFEDVTILLTFNTLPTPAQAPKLEYVQLMSAGANHILKNPLFTDTDVAFCTANGVHGPQISEWILATYLAFEHQIPQYLEKQKQARWERDNTLLEDAVSKTVGILGYGSIGRQTARVATALGMKVHAYTLHARPTPESRRDLSWAPDGLGDPDGVFPSSGLDLLVIATPLTDNTRHLIAAAEFRILAAQGKGKTYVSNIARGPVVSTDDIIDALNQGLIRGAALDVTDPEPLPDGHVLWSTKNVIITPHVSGGSTSYNTRVLSILEHNLRRFSEGQELTNKFTVKKQSFLSFLVHTM